ncbi:MAG TPA: transcription antitermination factor NusB [Syntrophobacteria bacterium]|nr:transcription antitermination factor NusB [Syntrophobacteria bacterium]
MARRRRSREMAVKVLYQADMSGVSIAEAFQLYCAHFGGSEEKREFAKELLDGVQAHLDEINGLISRSSENWRLERMSLVDRNILRLAIYEILCRPDIPTKVSINEAVEIGKKFGSEESGAFINGILDRIRTHVRGEEEEAVPDKEGRAPGQTSGAGQESDRS